MASSPTYATMTNHERSRQDPNTRGKPVFVKHRSVPESLDKPLYADEMFKNLVKVIPSIDIKGIQRIGGLWRLYIANQNERIKLISNGMNIRNTSVSVFDMNPFFPNGREDTLKLLIKDIPLSVHESVIIDEMERRKCKVIGKIMFQKLRVDGKLTECMTGDCIVYIEHITSSLPRLVTFGPFKRRVFHF